MKIFSIESFLLIQLFQLRVIQHFKSEFSIGLYYQIVYLEKVFFQVKGVSRKIDQYGQT